MNVIAHLERWIEDHVSARCPRCHLINLFIRQVNPHGVSTPWRPGGCRCPHFVRVEKTSSNPKGDDFQIVFSDEDDAA